MTNIYNLQERANALRKRYIAASITPEEVGGLIADTLEFISLMERNAASLGITKVYNSIAAMEGDKSPNIDGKPLRQGQLVSIYNAENKADIHNGDIYMYGKDGWSFVSNIANVIVGSSPWQAYSGAKGQTLEENLAQETTARITAITEIGSEVAKLVNRLSTLENKKPSGELYNILEFDGFTNGVVTRPIQESATGDFKILFDVENKRFFAFADKQYYSGWLSNPEKGITDRTYQSFADGKPYSNKVYVNKADNSLYRWDGKELVKVSSQNGMEAVAIENEKLSSFEGGLWKGNTSYEFNGAANKMYGFSLANIFKGDESYRLRISFSSTGRSTDSVHLMFNTLSTNAYTDKQEYKSFAIGGDVEFNEVLKFDQRKPWLMFHMKENGSILTIKSISIERTTSLENYSDTTNSHLNLLDESVKSIDEKYSSETINWRTRNILPGREEGKTTLWVKEEFINKRNVFELNNHGQSIAVEVEDTKAFKIKNLSNTEILSFHLLKTYNGAVAGEKPDFYSEEKFEVKPNEEREFTRPSDVEYVYVRFRNGYNTPLINFDFSWRDRKTSTLINEEIQKNKVKKIINLTNLMISGGAEAGQEVNSKRWVGTQDFLSRDDYDAFEYNMFAQSNCGINFYDKNKKFCAFHQISKSNGELKHVVVEFPLGAKYAKITAKGRAQGDFLYGIKYEDYSAQKLFDKIQGVESAAANGGYVYLAGNYGISVDNPDNAPQLTALFEKVNQAGGGIVELPKGVFVFKSTVKFMSNIHLRGQGIGNTVLDMQDGVKNNYSLFEGDFVYNIAVSDLEVQSPNTTSTGKHFFMRYIKDAHFTRIKSVGSRPTALGIDFLNRVTITDNIIINAGRGGHVFGHACIGIGTGYDEWDAEDIVIANNICVGGGMRGIFVEDQKRFTLARDGKMKSGKGQVITGNVVRKCNRGITVETGRYVNISGNTIYDCNEGLAIHIWADDCLFASNLLVNNKVGISVAELEHVTSDNISFVGNSIHNSITAINIDTKGLMNNIAIKDNVFRNCENGVNIQGDTNRLVIQSNNDFSSKKSFVLAGNITDPIIKDNTFFVAPENTATMKGITKFVEQLN